MEKFTVENHEASLLPEGKKWSLVWQDEFDGDALDETKWSFRLHLLQQRHETFTTEGVVLDGESNLKLYLTEKDGQYYSPHLQTGENFMDRPGEGFAENRSNECKKFIWPIAKRAEPKFLHKYGYYEIRCKLQEQPGWWSAFWLQSPIIGATSSPEFSGIEVDIMENFSRDGEVTSGNIYGGYGSDIKGVGRIRYKVEKTQDGFHHFGLLWSPDGYTFYADGKETLHLEGPVSHTEQFILVSTECGGYRKGNAPSEELKTAVLPDCFTVDFVRVFDEVK